MILLIDNYDSFVHNLARYFRRLGQPTWVVRNDAVPIENLQPATIDAIVFSPGPRTPREAGQSLELVRRFWTEIPMLGVCLGHQTIAAAFGASIVRATEPMHGRASEMWHHGEGLFAGFPNPLSVGRYHSLAVDPRTLPTELQPTAFAADGTLMAFEHRERPLVGWQFHPESILTPDGYALLSAFLRRIGIAPAVDDLTRKPEPLPRQRRHRRRNTPWIRDHRSFSR